LSQYLTQKAVGQFDLGPAGAFSLIYFLIISLLCFILYNWMQQVGTRSQGANPWMSNDLKAHHLFVALHCFRVAAHLSDAQ
jgi:hypothetical protein